LPEQLIDAGAVEKKDLKQLEVSLQSLWEKARFVSDELLRLKKENRELQNRISSLEIKESQWAESLRQREQEFEDVTGQLEKSGHEIGEVRKQLELAQLNGSGLFSKEESEVIKTRLKELIEKINSRL